MRDMHTRYERRLFYALLGLLIFLPIPLGSDRPWAWGIVEFWTFTLTAFWVLGSLTDQCRINDVFRSAKPVLVLFGAWLAYTGLMLVPLPVALVELLSPKTAQLYQATEFLVGERDWIPLSLYAHGSAVAWLKSLAYILIFCLLLLLVNSRHRLYQLMGVLVYCGLAQAVYGGLTSMASMNQFATGTFVNRNHLAGYLEITLAIGIGLLIAQLGGREAHEWRQFVRNILQLMLSPKMRLRVYLAIMVIALVLTHSRMGNSAFFTSLMITGVIGLILSRHAVRSMVILFVSLIVIDIFIVGTWFGIERVAERIQQTTAESEVARTSVDSYAIEIWRDYPVFGSGAGTFEYMLPMYEQGDLNIFYDHVHNDYLEIALENGTLGFVLLAASVLWTVVIALRAQYCRHDPLMRGASFAAIMGIISIMIHSTVDFNLHIPANAAMFMVLMALGWIAMYHRHNGHNHIHSSEQQ